MSMDAYQKIRKASMPHNFMLSARKGSKAMPPDDIQRRRKTVPASTRTDWKTEPMSAKTPRSGPKASDDGVAAQTSQSTSSTKPDTKLRKLSLQSKFHTEYYRLLSGRRNAYDFGRVRGRGKTAKKQQGSKPEKTNIDKQLVSEKPDKSERELQRLSTLSARGSDSSGRGMRLSPQGSVTRESSARSKSKSKNADDKLPEEVVAAFREVFDLFDSNGGGTIDAEELDSTLQSLDIHLSPEEIYEVLSNIDADGNGEIDFDEFLQLMTSTEQFLESVACKEEGKSGSRRQFLFFEALTQFMKKSALTAMEEIVGYYTTKYRKFQSPHVVGHYAAGARLIGLTEKQLVEHLRHLKATNAGEKSPYAQALHILPSNPSRIHELIRPQRMRRKRGKITLKIHIPTSSQTNLCKEDTKIHSKDKTVDMKTGPDQPLEQRRKGGWMSQRLRHIMVQLPAEHIRKIGPFDNLTAEDLTKIRNNVTKAIREYRDQRRKEYVCEQLEHWRTLEAGNISPKMLRHHFQRVFATYSQCSPKLLPVTKKQER